MNLPETLAAADEALLRVARGSPGWAVPLFVGITVVGGGWGIFPLLFFLRRKESRRVTGWLLGCLVATSAVVGVLKALFGRVRPCDALAGCPPVFVASPGGHSFPSGHAAGSFAFAAFVATTWPRFAAPALVFAALVAWSRCFLGVHYPSDITAGALIGSLLGFVFAKLAAGAGARGSSRSETRSTAASHPGSGDTGTPG